ncbi:MAG: tetratricopeptide repeat protein, partial [Gammaproteobacteria bacterium]|nr:tetratricopeptide repeat protein [Gammaproteobacteria bacterium]
LFAHDYAKIAVRDRYLPTEKKQQQAHRSLAKCFASKPVDSRVVEELPHQWREAKAWRDLERTLTRLEVFEALITHRSQEEHLGYWLSMEAAHNKQMLEQSMRRAWRRWALSEKEEYTGDVADSLAILLRAAGRGLTESFVLSLARLSLSIAEKVQGPEHLFTGPALNNLACLLGEKGDDLAAEPLYRRALAIIEKKEGVAHPDTALSLNNLASCLARQSNYAEAEPLFRRALAIAESALGPEHSFTGLCLDNLALLQGIQGDYASAELLSRRALAIAEKSQGPAHPETGKRLDTLASLLSKRGDNVAAEQLYRRALAIAEKSQGPAHPETGKRLDTLASVLFKRGDNVAAEQLYRRALAIAEKFQGPEHPDTSDCLNNLAASLEAMGDYACAEPLYFQALAIAEKVYGNEHPRTIIALRNIAMLLFDRGRYVSAEPLYRRAMEITIQANGRYHSDSVWYVGRLSNLLRALGRVPDPFLLTSRGDFLIVLEFAKSIARLKPIVVMDATNFLAGLVIATRHDNVWSSELKTYMTDNLSRKICVLCARAEIDLERSYDRLNEKIPLSDSFRRILAVNKGSSLKKFIVELLGDIYVSVDL